MKAPLERAARALCNLDGHAANATVDGKPLWQRYLPEARAVLLAIREPSRVMVDAASETVMHYPAIGDPALREALIKERSVFVEAWNDMINAALKEVP